MRTRLALAVAAALLASACSGAARTAPSASGPPPTTVEPQPSLSPSPTSAPRGAALSKVRVRLKHVTRLDSPLAMAVRKDDPTMYVAEQIGRVMAVSDGRVLRKPVLDITGAVTAGGEQGLLGLAFSPSGTHLYVNYTDHGGNTRIVEFAMNGDRADPGSRRQLLGINQPFPNHNGGQLAFGPDGDLYIGLGDGGAGGDPFRNGQSLRTLLGKILRIDPRPGGGKPYRIPEDNPFVGRDKARPEIWAYGLRNPWRFSFDRESGDLWIGDVGQSSREEIDVQRAGSRGGRNYGWNLREGTLHYASGNAPHLISPIYEYPTGDEGTCAVIGGYVYRGTRIPKLTGAYLFADFCQGRVMALRQRGGRVREHRALGPTVGQLSSFGQDGDGELYVLSLEGKMFRLDPK